MSKPQFDPERFTRLTHSRYRPWAVQEDPIPVSKLSVADDTEILVARVGGRENGFLVRELIPRHSAQGTVNGEDFLLTFCGACNAGIVMDPVIDGRVHHFQVAGAYNGQAVFEDRETGSIWNHLTGECVYGELEGTVASVRPPERYTLRDLRNAKPDCRVFLAPQSLQEKLMGWLMPRVLNLFGDWMPKRFRKQLTEVDPRLPKLTLGIAVRVDSEIRFYPRTTIEDGMQTELGGAKLTFYSADVPYALDEHGERPFQLLIRWYGFSLTFPEGTLYGESQ
jgi:hypothetical protein